MNKTGVNDAFSRCFPSVIKNAFWSRAEKNTEKHFRRIDGHQELWTLAAILGREVSASKKEKVA